MTVACSTRLSHRSFPASSLSQCRLLCLRTFHRARQHWRHKLPTLPGNRPAPSCYYVDITSDYQMISLRWVAKVHSVLACRRPGETWQTCWTPPPTMTWHAPPGVCRTCKVARLAPLFTLASCLCEQHMTILADTCAAYRRLQGSGPASY